MWGLGFGPVGAAFGGGEVFGEGGQEVVFGGAGEEVYVDGLEGLGVDAGSEAEFEGESGGGFGVFGFGDEYEVVPAEDHVAGEEAGAGDVYLVGDVVNEVRVVDQLLLSVGCECGEEYVKHDASRRERVWGDCSIGGGGTICPCDCASCRYSSSFHRP